MYGKPPPKGCGSGWSGWYKGWFFRSLTELSFMINVIEKNDLCWKSAEGLIKIEYVDYIGKIRNYYPDFLINNKYIVEIKPLKLHSFKNVSLKTEAAIKYCEKAGLIYIITDCEKLSEKEIDQLYLNKDIIFTNKCEKKYLDRVKTLKCQN